MGGRVQLAAGLRQQLTSTKQGAPAPCAMRPLPIQNSTQLISTTAARLPSMCQRGSLQKMHSWSCTARSSPALRRSGCQACTAPHLAGDACAPQSPAPAAARTLQQQRQQAGGRSCRRRVKGVADSPSQPGQARRHAQHAQRSAGKPWAISGMPGSLTLHLLRAQGRLVGAVDALRKQRVRSSAARHAWLHALLGLVQLQPSARQFGCSCRKPALGAERPLQWRHMRQLAWYMRCRMWDATTALVVASSTLSSARMSSASNGWAGGCCSGGRSSRTDGQVGAWVAAHQLGATRAARGYLQ